MPTLPQQTHKGHFPCRVMSYTIPCITRTIRDVLYIVNVCCIRCVEICCCWAESFCIYCLLKKAEAAPAAYALDNAHGKPQQTDLRAMGLPISVGGMHTLPQQTHCGHFPRRVVSYTIQCITRAMCAVLYIVTVGCIRYVKICGCSTESVSTSTAC